MRPVRKLERKMAARPWAGLAALAFVLVTLAALVAVPLFVQERVDALRGRIETAEPARSVIGRLQYSMMREMASLTEVLLTGNPAYSRTYAAARDAERRYLDRLDSLTAELGPEVHGRMAHARTLTERWHAQLEEDAILRSSGLSRPSAQVLRETALFEEALRATGAVDAAIVDFTGEVRDSIAATEDAGLLLTALLGVLAVLSAAAVGALHLRVRSFAAESEERRREAEEALAEVARANEARARLLRGITHDVKNPLGAARGYADLLALEIKAPLAPGQAPLVEGVKRSVDGALAIISDLLDVARADSGGLQVNRVPADLEELAARAVDDHRAAAEAAGHALRLEPCSDPARVYTDPVRVAQVLGNLLSNAVKYTPPPGRITVRAETVEGEAGPRPGAWAAVRVTDTGPGIPPEMREAVFDEFTRLDEGAPAAGHGLGLAIARRVARMLGGDLTVDGGPGEGASFVLWLPRRDDADPPADA